MVAAPERHTFDSPTPTLINLPTLARLARNNRENASLQQNYGLALIHAGRIEEALPWLEAAAALAPENAAHHVNLSSTYRRLERDWDRAYRHAAEAHRLNPTSPLATNNLAAIHAQWGEMEQAAAWYQRTLDLDPSNWLIWCAWIYVRDMLSLTPGQALVDRRAVNTAIQRPVKAHWPAHENDPDPERKLRLGFTGGDFRTHSAATAFGPVLAHLDRERFEVVCYADLSVYDDATDRFRALADRWHAVTGLADEQIAALVQHDQIDVLVDLGAFSARSHLLVHLSKPAPLSVTAWGYLTGTGLDAMDGILIDEVLLPRDRAWEVTEQPLYVPSTLGFDPPDETVEIVPRETGAPLVFGYLGRFQKIGAETVRVWAEVLHAYPGSRLLVKDGLLAEERAASGLLARFAAHGIDPARIELRYHTSREEHRAVYNEIDVALDTVRGQGSGMTTLEALSMGTPTVALSDPAARLISRSSASSLTAAGHPEWIASTTDEYVRLAGALASQGGTGLREQFLASPACDGAGRARAFEGAVRDLWRAWCRKRVAV